MIELTEQQQQALHAGTGEPPRVANPATNEKFVLIPEDLYDKMQALLGEDEPRQLEPLLAELSPEDWEDASNYETKP